MAQASACRRDFSPAVAERRLKSVLQAKACATVFALMLGCSTSAPPARQAAPPSEPVRITQFYAAEPQIAAGGKTLLCYGVENAQSVRLNGERVSPALSRCIEVSPARTTTYTLTAEGGGHKAEQTTTVSVGAPKPPGPKIIEVRVSALKVRPRQAVSICYRVEHASRVSIEPGGPQRSPAEGCLVVQPEHTTTYVVTASAANGAKDTERVTVSVEQ